MQNEQAPVSIMAGSFSTGDLLVPGLIALIALVLLFGFRREFATFALAMCVFGALLVA